MRHSQNLSDLLVRQRSYRNAVKTRQIRPAWHHSIFIIRNSLLLYLQLALSLYASCCLVLHEESMSLALSRKSDGCRIDDSHRRTFRCESRYIYQPPKLEPNDCPDCGYTASKRSNNERDAIHILGRLHIFDRHSVGSRN